MIIFGLDGVLADCEHRRHFVDPSKDENAMQEIFSTYADGRWWDLQAYEDSSSAIEWKPNWKSFYKACGKDLPIEPAITVFHALLRGQCQIEIWSGRCESVRVKTYHWICEHIFNTDQLNPNIILKMRPQNPHIKELNGCSDAYLKAIWLEEEIAVGETIDFVFESDPESIKMFRSRGIFVFDVNQ